MGMRVRGRGLLYGLEMDEPGLPAEISKACFEKGLVIELAGAKDQVLKFLPPLLIEEEVLKEGLAIVAEVIDELVSTKQDRLGGAF